MTPRARVAAVSGYWPRNGGSQLMLLATSRQLEQRHLATAIGLVRRADRHRATGATLPVVQVLEGGGGWKARAAGALLGHLPTSVAAPAGLVAIKDTVGLLDLSGFAISDQWGPAKALDRARRAQAYAARGRPVVFLPQSIGPLRHAEVRAALEAALDASSLFCVRERSSLDHAVDAGFSAEQFVLAPDLTLGATGGPAADPDTPELVVCPNERLTASDTGALDASTYVTLLEAICREGVRQGRRVRILTHGGEEADHRLAEALAGRMGLTAEKCGGQEFKAQIGPSTIVVASRFHALLSALSRGGACLALGWSHKYAAAMEQFDLGGFSLPADVEVSTVVDAVRALDEIARSGRQVAVARSVVDDAQRSLDELWARVAVILGAGAPGSERAQSGSR